MAGGKDPRDKYADFLTDESKSPDTQTRMMNRHQKNWTLANKYIGDRAGLSMSYRKKLAEQDERLMVAFQGRRSEEVVEATKAVEESKVRSTGIQAVIDHKRARSDGDSQA